MVENVFSKWIEARAYHKVEAKDVVNFLVEEIISRYGPPKKIVSDKGSVFTSNAFRRFCQMYHITLQTTAIYHQRANPVERKVQDLKKILRALMLDKSKNIWDQQLLRALHAFRSKVNDAIGTTPAKLLLGYNLPRPGDWEVPAYAEERQIRET